MPETTPQGTRDRYLALARPAQAYLFGLSSLAAGIVLYGTGADAVPTDPTPLALLRSGARFVGAKA